MAEMFGSYRLDALLGRGAMGEVHRAFDTVRGRFVALKLLPPVLSADPQFRARFQAESALAARLNDPHVIPIHDFGEVDGRLFLDMRLVEGQDVAAFLAAHGPLPPERAVRVVTQVASALDAAHAAGMVHRDIKPSNVLIASTPEARDGEDFVYLADFGIARAISETSTSLTLTGGTVGSLDYMAPERFSGGHGDQRADVYALGCLLFEVLTARKPYVVDGLPALLNAHLNLPPPRPSELVAHLPAGLDAVVARAMAKDPAARYPSAGELAAAARAAAGPAPVDGTAAPEPPDASWSQQTVIRAPMTPPALINLPAAVAPSPARPTGRRRVNRLAVVLSALAVLVVVIGGGALALGLGRGDGSDVRTDPIGVPGANPFMPPAGQDRTGVTPPPNTGGSFTGQTPGLYGGTRNQASCDPDAMVTFLQSHPDKAAAWANVQGITPQQIPSYVAGLTPVILRSDTAVTNHGFAGGRATIVPAVLQAGTAVLIDSSGVPRAKCYCGNPLTPPATVLSPRYVGGAWSGFAPGAVTRVTPAPGPISEFTLVDPDSGQTFIRPRGSRGSTDRPVQTQPDTTPTPTPTPTPSPTEPDLGTTSTGAPAPVVISTTTTTTAPPHTLITTLTQQAPVKTDHAPVIVSTSTYQEGVLIYVRVNYTDQDGDAEGFGFAWIVGGRDLGTESHPFTSPSYGRVSPGRVDYPFNSACGQSNQYQSDVRTFIYDSGGRRSDPVIVHLACS